MFSRITFGIITFSSFLFSAQSFAFDHSHKAWDVLLKKYVKVAGPASTVDYKTWKTETGALDTYLAELSGVAKSTYDSWTENQKMAFLLNAYNGYTIRLILNNYPVKSIKKIGGLFSSPWKQKFFKLFGEEKHLDGIEHDMLRKDFKEARVHFGVVCASIGCPQLRKDAFTPDKVREQLEAGAVAFLSDTSRNRWNKEKGELELSNIFKWFSEDFTKEAPSVGAWVSKRMSKDPAEIEKISNAKISHLDYDWNLNEVK